MKNVYRLCVCLATFVFSAKAQDYSQANYTPVTLGTNTPVTYTDARVVRNNDPETRLLASIGLIEQFATTGNGAVDITWRTNYEPDLTRYEIQYSKDNITYERVGVVTAGAYLNGKAYTFRHNPVNAMDRVFYRILAVDKSGRWDLLPVISQVMNGNARNSVFPTVVNSGQISVNLNDSFEQVQIIDQSGKILQSVNLNGKTGRTDIALSQAARGICFVRILGSQHNNQPRQNIVQKVFIQ